jgi:hypothetical protein
MAEPQKKRAPRAKTAAKTEPTQPTVTVVTESPIIEAQPATPTLTAEKKPRQPRQAPFDYKGAAIAKYEAAGWHIHKYPVGSLNDFSADRDKKLHHVQVVPSDKAEDNRYSGEAKNTFINNAMPHSAVPVHARVTLVEKEGSQPTTNVSFVDVNLNKKVVISPQKRKKADDK